MNKQDFITAVSTESGETKATVDKVLSATFKEVIPIAVESNDPVNIPDFGKFFLKRKAPRIGRNPQTGEEVQIPEKNVLGFKISSVLKKRFEA
jgi:DNA-binding protein HU-beta